MFHFQSREDIDRGIKFSNVSMFPWLLVPISKRLLGSIADSQGPISVFIRSSAFSDDSTSGQLFSEMRDENVFNWFRSDD